MRDRSSYLRYQAAVILSFGKAPKCERCENTLLDELVVNHRRRDGAKDRSETKPGVALYRKIIRMGIPARLTYELCCANHNLSDERRHYRGEQVYEPKPDMETVRRPLPLFASAWHDWEKSKLEVLFRFGLGLWVIEQGLIVRFDGTAVSQMPLHRAARDGFKAIHSLIAYIHDGIEEEQRSLPHEVTVQPHKTRILDVPESS